MNTYLESVNAGAFYLIVAVVLLFITCMCGLFLVKSYKAGIQIGMNPKVLKKSINNRKWTLEEKLSLINKYKSGKSLTSVAIEAGINDGLLHSWIRKYEELGYNGLVESKKGRPRRNPDMSKKIINQRELTESELEELVRLRVENEYIKTEIEALKKSIALRKEKEAAQLKAKKQRLLKNLENKDTN